MTEMNKKIMFIVPPGISNRGATLRIHPPDGIACVSSELLENGYDVRLLDSKAEGYNKWREYEGRNVRITGLDQKSITREIEGEEPRLIGIHYGVSTDHFSVKNLVGEIKNSFETPIVLGGFAASALYKEILGGTEYEIEKIPGVDFVISGRGIGAGERVVTELLEKIEKVEKDFHNIRGLVFKEKGHVIETNPPFIDLKNLKIPARAVYKKVDGSDIYSQINNPHSGPIDNLPYAILTTSRNCNYKCTFCSTPYGWDRKSINLIKKELRQLREEGVRTVQIEDDNFGGHREKDVRDACKVADKIYELDFKELDFPNGLTIRSMIGYDFALLRKLRTLSENEVKIGISVPFESGSDYTLEISRKPHNMEMSKKLLNELVSGGYVNNPNFNLEAFFMVGVINEYGDRERWEDIRKTFEFAEEVGRKYEMRVNVWICKPNPPNHQYREWRKRNPEAGFEKLMFSDPSGIWGNEEEEMLLFEKVKQFNEQTFEEGFGSKRNIFK